ncbi:MAG: NADH-quinone oxidoreductase subunit E, partial [Actinobacteria bacterium]
MDLRLSSAEPTVAERDAVDAALSGVLGPSSDAARGHRHLLLPALHAVSDAVGWISPGALNHIARRLSVPPAEVYGVATFYAMFSTEPRAPR